MKVLYFSQDYTPHDHRFLEALARTDHQVGYLRLQDAGKDLERRPIPIGIEHINWWGGRRVIGRSEYSRAAAELRGVIDGWAPDLVHAGPIQDCAFIAAEAGVHPLVAMSWGSDLLLTAEDGERRELAKQTLHRAEILACDCDAVRDVAIQLGMVAERIAVFPWGVDLQQFTPAGSTNIRRQLDWEEAFVLLSTRWWERLTGVDLLAQAFVKAAGQDEQLRLIMLGSGTLDDEIRTLIVGSNLSDRVHFAGQLDQVELPDAYRSADLYLSASHSDGSSVSLMEAMATGTPPLVSDIPGNREWVRHGENGWLFPDSDIEAMAEGILAARREMRGLTAAADAARRTALERADWARNFPKLLEAYRMARTISEAAL